MRVNVMTPQMKPKLVLDILHHVTNHKHVECLESLSDVNENCSTVNGLTILCRILKHQL
jgi:hypothetical protein